MTLGDLFNDGRVDIVVEHLEGQPMILRPPCSPSDHRISFDLEGTKSNWLALNARVKITAGNLVQTGQVLSGGSYLPQRSARNSRTDRQCTL